MSRTAALPSDIPLELQSFQVQHTRFTRQPLQRERVAELLDGLDE
jgi:hypothetical protein